ncbi:MAG: hypothetical protein QM775_29205 [Pirellulales bacterium]
MIVGEIEVSSHAFYCRVKERFFGLELREFYNSLLTLGHSPQNVARLAGTETAELLVENCNGNYVVQGTCALPFRLWPSERIEALTAEPYCVNQAFETRWAICIDQLTVSKVAQQVDEILQCIESRDFDGSS